jgi:hypothetical protein
LDSLNHPHFYISERCENIISGLSEYSGDEGPEESWKDAVDVIRYAAIANICYIDESKLNRGRSFQRGY